MTSGGCGHENQDGRKFCTECGAALARTCPGCAAPVGSTQKFCGDCGASLAAPTAAPAPTPTPEPVHPAPPEPLARRILDERRELEGERKQVTVVFADVSGPMDLAEGLGAEEWARIMDRFFALLTEGVQRYDGTVDKFTGDGVMAIFGAPVAYEDHARRACHAALALIEAVSAYVAELRQAQGLAFHLRVGLNSGEVVVGRIGDDARMEYTALGHTVGLAQRMESLAEPGNAYLSEHTARLVAGSFRLRDLGPCAVKGASEPVGALTQEVAYGPLLSGRRARLAATALIVETGAVVYEPFVAEEHARLTGDRDALAAAAGAYRAIGAAGHADRLEAELGRPALSV